MPFTVEDFQDLLRLLEERPDWRAELRRWVLTDDLLRLPEAVRELVEAQQRTEERVGRLEEALARLAEAQQRTEERVAQQGDRLDSMRGDILELRYERHAPAYFAPLARRIQVVSHRELQDLLERGLTAHVLTEEEYRDVLLADLIIRGRRWAQDEEIYLVVEVSAGIGVPDVERAARRAELLGKLGVATTPVVAGTSITRDAEEMARDREVTSALDGRVARPETL